MTTPARPGNAGLDELTRRRALRLSAATAASAGFGLIGYDPLKLVPVNAVHAVLLLILAAVAFAGARLRRRVVLVVAGALMVALALVRLVTYGHGSGLITGSVGTAALLAGLGMAFVGIVLAGHDPAS